MARTVTVTVPHTLGAEQAKQRISSGLDKLRAQYASQLSAADVAWRGNHADLRVGALGQTIDARLDVEEQAVRIEVDLPWLLQKLAAPLEKFLTRTGADTLRLGKS